MDIELRKRHLQELKQFARAEMARELAGRHGRKLRLPWDPDEAPAAQESAPSIDTEALQELSGVLGGD